MLFIIWPNPQRAHCKVHGDVGWKPASAVSAGFSSEAAHTVYLALNHTLAAERGAVCLLMISTTKTYCTILSVSAVNLNHLSHRQHPAISSYTPQHCPDLSPLFFLSPRGRKIIQEVFILFISVYYIFFLLFVLFLLFHYRCWRNNIWFQPVYFCKCEMTDCPLVSVSGHSRFNSYS